MTGPNAIEELESKNSGKKVNYENIYAKAYKEFIQDGIYSKGVDFVNTYYAKPDTDLTYRDEFMSFINSKSSSDSDYFELDESFRDKMSLGKIKVLLGPEFAKLKNHRKIFKDTVLKNYQISPSEYTKKIESSIEKHSLTELQKLISQIQNIDAYLASLGIEAQKRSLEDFLEKMDVNGSIQKIKNPVTRKKVELEVHSQLIDLDPKSPLFADKFSQFISKLFSYNLISDADKKNMVLSFIPVLTLSEAKRFGLIDEKEIEKYLKDTILNGLDSGKKDEIYSKLASQLDTLLIESDLLVGNDVSKIELIANKKGFQDLAQQLAQEALRVDESEPQNFDDLLKRLTKKQKVSGIEHFKQGNIMQIDVSQDGGSIQSQYYEIFAVKNRDGEPIVSFVSKGGDGVYFPENDGPLEKKTYSEFDTFSNFETVKSIDFVSSEAFQGQIALGNIKQETSSYTYKAPSEVSKMVDGQRESLSSALISGGLMNQGEDVDTVISRLKNEEKEEYKNLINAYLKTKNQNIENVISEINSIDSQGNKFGCDTGTSFQTKNAKDYYTIESIQDNGSGGEIIISRIGGVSEKVDFFTFIQTFKEKGCERTAKVRGQDDFIEGIDAGAGSWSKMNFQNGKLLKKGDDKNTYECDYLAADQGDAFWHDYNVVKIESFDANNARVRLGKIQKGKNKSDPTTYAMSRDIVDVSYGILASWSTRSGLSPKNLKQENISNTDLPEGNKHRKNSLGSYYVNNFYNIATIVAAGKKYVDFFKEYFEEGKEDQVSRLVSKFPLLNAEQRSAAITYLENASKKRTEEYVEKLKVRDSAEAIGMVEKWLLNNNSPQSQKEAAVFYMIEKYGVLYEKGPLMKHKGTFLWYEALGGKIGDQLFMEEKALSEKYEIQFTEEDLVYALLAKQCKGYLKPKRRGKLYKEYEAKIGKGLEDEIEKGKKDAGKKRTPEQREKFAVEEAEGGGWPNAFGAMEELVNKGFDGDIARLNAVPFVLMTSGSAYSFAPGKADKFKNGMVPTQFFTAKKTHIDIYNNTVLKLAKDIENTLGGEYKDMYKELDDLITRGIGINKDGVRTKLNEGEKVRHAFNLFQKGKWGETISRALMMLNTRQVDKESEFETWIIDNADDPVYAGYKELFFGGLDATNDARLQNTDVLDDGMKSTDPGTGGFTGWDTYSVASKYIKAQSGAYGFRDQKFGTMVWTEITAQIDATAANTYLSEDKKRSRISAILKDLMDAISESYGQRDGELKNILSNPSGVFHDKFKTWGVQTTDWDKGDRLFRDGSFDRGEEIINRYVDNILSGRLSKNEPIDSTKSYRISDIQSSIQSKTAANLQRPSSAGDDDYSIAA